MAYAVSKHPLQYLTEDQIAQVDNMLICISTKMAHRFVVSQERVCPVVLYNSM